MANPIFMLLMMFLPGLVDENLTGIDYLLKNNNFHSLIILIFAVSTALLLVFSLMLARLIRQRTQANRILALQKQDIEQRNARLQVKKDKILQQNEALETANQQISLLNQKLDQQIKFSEKVLRSAYENAPESFFIIQAETKNEKVKSFICLDVNKAATQLLERPKDEIEGESMFNLLPFLKEKEYAEIFSKVYAENRDFEQEVYVNGGKFPEWVQLMANPIEGGIALKIKNITNRKKQEKNLKEREASISAMINNTSDMILSVDSSLCLTEFNEPFVKTTEAFSGLIPKRGQSVFDAIHPQNVESARKNFEQALKGISSEDHYEIPAPDGTTVYAEAFFSPVVLENQPIGATVVIRNITERKKNEIQLKEALSKVKESENFLNEIIENLPVGLQIYDARGDLIRMNRAQMELLGMTDVLPGQINVLKEPFYKVYGIDHFFEQAYQGTSVINHEVFIDKGNASEEWQNSNQKAWLSIATIPVKDENGFVKSVIGLCSDITERKEAELALSESEERLRMVINNIPIVLWTTDKDGIFTMSEGKALESMALQPGQVVGVSMFDLYADYQDQLYILKDALKNGMPYEGTNQLGKTIFNIKIFPQRNEENEIAGMIGMLFDITDRVQNEEKLKRSEASLNAIINNNTYNIWSVDTDLKLMAVNDSFKEAFKLAFGRELEIGDEVSDFVPAKEIDMWKGSYQKVFSGKQHSFEYSFAKRYYEVSMYPIINDGKITGVAVFSQDATERKLAENQIRENQHFLNGIIENLPIGLQIFDHRGYLVQMNEALRKSLKLTDINYGVGTLNIFTDPISLKNGITALAKRASKGETITSHEIKLNFSGENNQWDMNKDDIWHNINVFPISQDDGQIKAIVFLTEDITERKRTEEKLIDSEKRLSLATKTASIGIWDIDLQKSTVLWDQTMMDIYGFTDESFVQNLEFWNQCLHPEDKERVLQETAGLQEGNRRNTSEFRIIRADGEVRHIRGLAQLLQNEGKQPTRIIGVNLDITENKEQEERLQQQQQEIIKTNKIVAEYKLMALRSAMNPHFLFNSLNSIQYFIAKNERELALNYLSLFSKLIRGVLNSSVSSTLSLSHELEVLRYYIELEALRFESKFKVSFVMDDGIDLENIEIPSLLIQPYVENAIIHGLYNKTGPGKLTISLSPQDGLLKCVVEDDGVGRKEAMRIKKTKCYPA